MLTKFVLDEAQLADLVAPIGRLASAETLSGGMFATAYRVRFDDGSQAVAKIVGADTSRLFQYELGLLGTEALTYRMGAHTTSDDPTKYRTSDEEESWARRDPIARMHAYLRSRGASDAFFDGVEADAAAYADDVRVRTNALGDLDREVMFGHVYSEPHPLIDEQRRWLADYEASFAASGTEGGTA